MLITADVLQSHAPQGHAMSAISADCSGLELRRTIIRFNDVIIARRGLASQVVS